MSYRLRQSIISIVFVCLLYVGVMLARKGINDHGNQRELTVVEGGVHEVFSRFVAAIETETEWNVHITSGRRSREEQERLHRLNPRNAAPGRSKHEQGLAIDINLYSTFTLKHIRKADTRETWMASGVPEIAKRFGLKWGGDYRTYHDPVHFEVMSYGGAVEEERD